MVDTRDGTRYEKNVTRLKKGLLVVERSLFVAFSQTCRRSATKIEADQHLRTTIKIKMTSNGTYRSGSKHALCIQTARPCVLRGRDLFCF